MRALLFLLVACQSKAAPDPVAVESTPPPPPVVASAPPVVSAAPVASTSSSPSATPTASVAISVTQRDKDIARAELQKEIAGKGLLKILAAQGSSRPLIRPSDEEAAKMADLLTNADNVGVATTDAGSARGSGGGASLSGIGQARDK